MTRTIHQVLLPLMFIVYFFSSYHSSWLPCLPRSIELSLTAAVGHFISKKAFLILLCGFILLFLAIDFNLCGSSQLMNNLDDESLMRLGNHLLSPSDDILTEPHTVEEEKIAVEESFYLDLFASMQDGQPRFYERYGGGDLGSRVQTLSQGWWALEDRPWQSYSLEVEDVAEERDAVESAGDLDVVVVKEVIREEINPVGTRDEFEGLTIDELELRFEEFIKSQKRKKRLESLQFVMA